MPSSFTAAFNLKFPNIVPNLLWLFFLKFTNSSSSKDVRKKIPRAVRTV